MELSDLGFDYKSRGGNAVFGFVSMNFDQIIFNCDSKEEIINKANSSINELENVLNNFYSGKRVKKEKISNIRSNNIEFGNSFEKGSCKSDLYYKIPLDSEGKPRDLKLSLFNSFSSFANKKKNYKILEIFDSIINYVDQENIGVSEKAKRQIDNINFLRNNNFDLNKYLKA